MWFHLDERQPSWHRDGFHGRRFSHRLGLGGWFQNDSSSLHLLCTLFLLWSHQLHFKSLGIRSQRLGSPGLGGGHEQARLCNWYRTHLPMWVQSLGQEDPLEEGMAIHSSILAWRISGTEEPDGLQSTGLQSIGHNWSNLADMSKQNKVMVTEIRKAMTLRGLGKVAGTWKWLWWSFLGRWWAGFLYSSGWELHGRIHMQKSIKMNN